MSYLKIEVCDRIATGLLQPVTLELVDEGVGG